MVPSACRNDNASPARSQVPNRRVAVTHHPRDQRNGARSLFDYLLQVQGISNIGVVACSHIADRLLTRYCSRMHWREPTIPNICTRKRDNNIVIKCPI